MVPGLGSFCDRPDHVALGRIMEKTFELCARKAIECSMPGELFCRIWKIRMLRAAQMREAWIVKFQREAKTPPELVL